MTKSRAWQPPNIGMNTPNFIFSCALCLKHTRIENVYLESRLSSVYILLLKVAHDFFNHLLLKSPLNEHEVFSNV